MCHNHVQVPSMTSAYSNKSNCETTAAEPLDERVVELRLEAT